MGSAAEDIQSSINMMEDAIGELADLDRDNPLLIYQLIPVAEHGQKLDDSKENAIWEEWMGKFYKSDGNWQEHYKLNKTSVNIRVRFNYTEALKKEIIRVKNALVETA